MSAHDDYLDPDRAGLFDEQHQRVLPLRVRPRVGARERAAARRGVSV